MSLAPSEIQARRPERAPSLSAKSARDIFAHAVKAAGWLSFNAYTKSAENLLSTVAAIEKASEPPALGPAEQAWVLLHRSAVNAILWTIRDHKDEIGSLLDDAPLVESDVLSALDSEQHAVSNPLLFRPASDPFFEQVTEGFDQWLRRLRLDEADRSRIRRHLEREYAFALAYEFRTHPRTYADIEEHFSPTLADEAAHRERLWEQYRWRLMAAVRRPVLDLGLVPKPEDGRDVYTGDPAMVALNELFIWPRGKYTKHEKSSSTDRRHEAARTRQYLVDAHGVVEAWANRQWASDQDVLMISGEAGIGKSSFARMIAAQWARDKTNVIYVPLNLLEYNGGNAWNAITEFISRGEQQFDFDVMAGIDAQRPLYLIIDGLDELSEAGTPGKNLAAIFLDSLEKKQNQINMSQRKLRIVLAGRPTVTAQWVPYLHADRQHIWLTRLGPISEFARSPDGPLQRASLIADPDQPGDSADLRGRWWRTFLSATDQTIPETEIPGVFLTNEGEPSSVYEELLDQLLLSYFLGLLYIKSYGSLRSEKSKYALYDEIFDLFRQRQAEKSRSAKDGMVGLFQDFETYKALLEYISEAAWHSGDRRVPRSDVVKKLKEDDPNDLIAAATDADISNDDVLNSIVGGIITSFFITSGDGEKIGEIQFAHRSFREFLTASRLVRIIEEYVERNKSSSGGRTALESTWFSATAYAPLSDGTSEFLRQGVLQKLSHRDHERQERWQDRWEKIFAKAATSGFSRNLFQNGKNFIDLDYQQRNASEATLVANHAIL